MGQTVPDLKRTRILIVEDEALLALALQQAVIAAGWDEVLLASRIDQALKVISASPPALVLLDINLQGQHSFPIADSLADAGIPFIFLTAQSREFVPRRHRARPFLEKPSDEEAVLTAIRMALGTNDAPSTHPDIDDPRR